MSSTAYRKRPAHIVRSLIATSALLGLSCGDDDDASGPKSVEIQFEARVGDQLVDCSQRYASLGNAGFADFRLYVYDVQLIDSEGAEVPVELEEGPFQYQNAALLDFENGADLCDTGSGTAALNTVLKGSVPAGKYKGLAFRVGLPSELNHSNPSTTPAPLNIGHLSWGWTGGRIFMNLDLVPEAGGGYPIHIGSMTCNGDAERGEPVTCAKPNITDVALDDFDPTTSKVVLDAGALLAGLKIAPENQGGDRGCMSSSSSATCQSVFAKLGIDAQSGSSSSTQTVFKAEAK